MREYEFRGKRLDNGEWVYGDLLQGCEICNICEISDKNSIDGTRYEVDPETVGQYTGLKDKNGIKIYEGDIVKALINGIWYMGQVIYEHSGFTIDVTNNKQLEFGRRGIIERFTEVIGNIWEDRNLINDCN